MIHFEGSVLSVINENGNLWYRGKDVGKILEYSHTRKAISYNIDKNEVRKLSFFQEGKLSLLKGDMKK